MKLPRKRCVFVYSECGYKEDRVEFCDQGKGMNLNGVKVASLVGSSVTFGLLNEKQEKFLKEFNGNYLEFNKGQKYNCLKEIFGDKWKNAAKSYIFDINMCVELFEKSNFKGRKELVCQTRNLTLLDKKVKSLRKFNLETKVILSTKLKNEGESHIYEE